MRRRSATAAAGKSACYYLFCSLACQLARASSYPSVQCTFPSPLEEVSLSCDGILGKQWSAADAAKHAVRHSPILHMHPAEDYKLTDPRMFWKAAKVYGENYEELDKHTVESLLSGAYANATVGSATGLVRSFLTVLPTSLHEATAAPSTGGYLDVMAGSPLDKQGHSKARVFYQLLQLPGGAWVYTYNLYYTWNGCGSMVYSTTVGHKPHTLEYIACPDSIHESDWERVSVVVCPSNTEPSGTVIAALLSQHNHNQLLDCRQAAGQPPLDLKSGGQQGSTGKCVWERGEDGQPHLAVYSALHSHANYQSPSNATVFGVITTSEGDGVWIVDRTAEGGPVFMPTASNVVPIPGSIPGLQAAADPEDWAWSQYPGWWGAAEWKIPGSSITCITPDRTAVTTCPDNAAWRLLAGLLGIPASHRKPPPADALVMRPYVSLPQRPAMMPYNYHGAGGAKQNPRYRVWASQWDGAKVPPMYDLPTSNALFRVFLNNGKRSPTFKCFPPMTTQMEAPRSQRRPGVSMLGVLAMTPSHPMMLLLTVPLTLTTAWVLLHIPRLATLPSVRSGALQGQVSQMANTLLSVSGASGQFQAMLPSWIRRGANSINIPPPAIATQHPPEVEMAHADAHGGTPTAAAAAATQSVSHRLLNGPTSRAPRSSGPGMDRTSAGVSSVGGGAGGAGSAAAPGSASSSRCSTRLVLGLLQQLGVLGRMVLGHLNFWAMLASIAAGVMYSVGLAKATAVLNGTLGVGAPLYNSLAFFTQAFVIALLVDHLLLLCCTDCLFAARPRRRSIGSPFAATTTLPGTLNDYALRIGEANGLEQDEEEDDYDGEAVHLMGQGSSPPPRTTAAGEWVGACLQRWRLACGSGNTHRCVNAALTSTANFLGAALTASAVFLVALQAGVQHACQQLVFGPAPHAIPSVITLRTDTTAYAGGLRDDDDIAAGRRVEQQLNELGIAAVFSPVGAIKPTQGPGKVYASALCMHWRDDYGAALLIVGAVVWCVLHMWLKAVMLHAVHEH